MIDAPEVLYEDNHCLAVNKPAGVLTMGDKTGEPSLVDSVREYLRVKYQKPGNVFVGVVHRLDRPVSGVVVFARTSKGASRLSEQFRVHSIEKTYLALVEGQVSISRGELRNRIQKDHDRNVISVVPNHQPGQDCLLKFEKLQRVGALTLMKILPQTGRSHQIRVQLSAAGWPIAGDRKYGSRHALPGFIALHAESLIFWHPTTRETIKVSTPCPRSWESVAR